MRMATSFITHDHSFRSDERLPPVPQTAVGGVYELRTNRNPRQTASSSHRRARMPGSGALPRPTATLVHNGGELPTMSPSNALIEGLQLSHVIGEGATSVVYRAVASTDLPYARAHETLAIKIFRSKPTGKQRVRFDRELALGLNMHSPHVVRYRASGTINTLHGEVPYIVMDFVGGCSLSNFVERLQSHSSEQCGPRFRRVFAHLLRALEELHLVGVIHRDLQPGNFRVRDDDSVVLLDLGVSKHLNDETLTSSWEEIGTRRYWAPECVTAEASWGPATDVFMLGSCLVHVLTGRYLFSEARTYPAFYRCLQHFDKYQSVPELEMLPGWLDPVAAGVLRAMVAARPNDRPPIKELLSLVTNLYEYLPQIPGGNAR
jgi:serine/threonine protein kinase